MAKIEKYVGQNKLSTEAQGSEINAGATGAVARQVEAAGQQLVQVGERFRRLNNIQQVNEASSGALQELNQIELDALNDPDLHKSIPNYEKRVGQVKEKYSNMVSDPEARLEFDGQLGSHVMTTMTKLTIEGRKQSIEKYKGSVFNYSQHLRQKYMTAPEGKAGDVERALAVQSIRNAYDKGVKIGAYNPDDAAKEVIAFEKGAKLSQAMHDIEQGVLPHSMIAQKLDKNEYGIEDPQALIHLKNLNDSVAGRRAAEAKAALEQRQVQNQGEVFKSIQAGEATVEQIMALEAAGELTPTQSNSLVQYLNSKDKINARDIPSEYAKLSTEYNSLNFDKEGNPRATFERISKFRENAMQAAARGVITEAKMMEFLGQVGKAFDEGLTDEIKSSYANRVKGSGFLGFWVDHYIEGDDAISEAKMVLGDQLMREIALAEQQGQVGEAELTDILNGLITEYVKKQRPELAAQPELPNAEVKGASLKSVSYSKASTKARWQYDAATGKVVKIEQTAEAGGEKKPGEKKKPEKKAE